MKSMIAIVFLAVVAVAMGVAVYDAGLGYGLGYSSYGYPAYSSAVYSPYSTYGGYGYGGYAYPAYSNAYYGGYGLGYGSYYKK